MEMIFVSPGLYHVQVWRGGDAETVTTAAGRPRNAQWLVAGKRNMEQTETNVTGSVRISALELDAFVVKGGRPFGEL